MLLVIDDYMELFPIWKSWSIKYKILVGMQVRDVSWIQERIFGQSRKHLCKLCDKCAQLFSRKEEVLSLFQKKITYMR